MADGQAVGLVRRARAFAEERHEGTFRRNKAHEPYKVHCHEVAELIEYSGGSETEIAAAWLHDTVEDTNTALKEIEELFGKEVKEIVDGLTDPPEFNELHTRERKASQAEWLRSKGVSIKRVKIADQISNIRSIAVDPPVNWSNEKCREYVEGALLVANECNGVDDFLDSQFELAYLNAIKSLSSP